MLSKKARVFSQVSGGPMVHCMKKQGPPPWGMKRDGWRAGWTEVLTRLSSLGSIPFDVPLARMMQTPGVWFEILDSEVGKSQSRDDRLVVKTWQINVSVAISRPQFLSISAHYLALKSETILANPQCLISS